MRAFALLLAAIIVSACTSMPIGNRQVPEPAKPVELSKYLGRWYEIARYENRFERGCEAVTADYSLRDDGRIKVLNTCNNGGITGPEKSSQGVAKIVENSDNAKLKVSFFGPFYGNYWVLDHAPDYSWSIVGEPTGKYLWILSREPKLSQKAENDLINRTRQLGYDTSLLRKTKQ